MKSKEMNGKRIVCFFVLCLGMMQLVAQSVTVAEQQFSGNGMEKVPGVLPVYYTADKIYLEIGEHILGRDILLNAQINQGAGLIGRSLESLGVVRFTKGRTGDIYLSREVQSERCSRKTNDLFLAFRNSTLQPVDLVYPVKGVTADHGYVIDITDHLKQNDGWFICKQKDLRGLAADRFYLKEVKAEEDGVRFSVVRSYGYIPNAPLGEMTHEGMIPVEIGCMLRVLSEEKMRIRYADPRVGYQKVNYTDYGENPWQAEPVSIIHRWRLTAGKSRQIVFYIAPSCPSNLVPFIIRGVEEWNVAFREAGFPDVLEARLADATTDLTAEKAVISYDFGPADLSHHWVTDISTGEILSCRINIGHGCLMRHLSDYLLQCGNSDPRIRKNSRDERVAGDILRSMISREVGFVLGLKPNDAGHRAFTMARIRDASWLKQYGYSASILDENPFNYAVQPADRVSPEYLIPRISVYDKWAIEWGYREFPGSKNEEEDRKALSRLSDKKNGNLFYVYADSAGHAGKQLQLGVLSDRLAVLKSGIGNLEQLMLRLKTEQDYRAGRKIMDEACGLYLGYVEEGCTLPLSRQTEWMDFLNDYLFAGVPDWLREDGQWREYRMLPENRMLKTGKEIFGRMLSPDVANDSLFAVLHEALFGGFDPQQTLPVFKMNLQGGFLTVFLERLKQDEVKSGWGEYAVVLWSEFGYLYDKIRESGLYHREERVRNYYNNMLRICNRELRGMDLEGMPDRWRTGNRKTKDL